MPPPQKLPPSRPHVGQIGSTHTRLYFPLYIKLLLVLLISFIPSMLLTASFVGALPPISATPIAAYLPAADLQIRGFLITPIELFASAVFLFSLLLGLSFANLLFVHTARKVLAILLEMRTGNFSNVRVLPTLAHDEVGEIGRQVAYASVQFSQVSDASKAANEQRSLFIMTAAHQLRTPLTGLIWTIEQLQKPETPEDEKRELLSAVDTSIRRMRLVIEHILASANVEEGRFGYVFEEVDLVPLVEKLVGEFKPLADKRRESVSFTHTESFPVYADAERISLVLFDFISNAIDYTPEGGSVTVSLTPQGSDIEVAVQDTGIGIAESELPKLFNKFYRSDRARHMRPDGSGLGLYLARTIVERHGSDITIHSKEGQGTRMSFLLHSEKNKVPRS